MNARWWPFMAETCCVFQKAEELHRVFWLRVYINNLPCMCHNEVSKVNFFLVSSDMVSRSQTRASEPAARGKFPWYAAFTAVQTFYATSLSTLWRIRVYMHIPDCVETLYGLPFVTNNTASETFIHKHGAVRSVDFIFNIGARTWRWMGEHVTLDKTF
jgi:hypothetical protein